VGEPNRTLKEFIGEVKPHKMAWLDSGCRPWQKPPATKATRPRQLATEVDKAIKRLRLPPTTKTARNKGYRPRQLATEVDKAVRRRSDSISTTINVA